MAESNIVSSMTRRRAFKVGSGVVGSLAAAGLVSRADADPAHDERYENRHGRWRPAHGTPLPVQQIEQIMQASGTLSQGVLSINIDRKDLSATLPGGVPVTPAELLNGQFYFQSVGRDKAIMNASFCLKPSEANPFIDALIANGLTIMAFHQHLIDMTPLYWFQHFRAVGNPLSIAQAVSNALKVTSTPLPQFSPPSLPTPFDAAQLARILGGTAQVGNSGVVTVSVPRAEQIHLAGIPIRPYLGVAAPIAFQPLDSAGSQALAIPDFAMIGREVDPVFQTMRSQGFTIGCLYNQETDERPQLYFSHQWAVGNPYDLANRIRKGLNLTNSALLS